jgi:hypothetical protein
VIHPPARHRQAAALLGGKRGLGSGEREALHLFFRVRADVIVTDDAAFVATLRGAGLPYLVLAPVLVRLAREQHLRPAEALRALERMRPFVRAEVYRAARQDLTAVERR